VVYSIRARNILVNAENKIHDDAVARNLGFAGGLVPGVTVFAYMTHPVVGTYGLEWFNCGTMSVRFDQPVYDGDEVEVKAGEEEASGMLLSVVTANGDCAYGRADLSCEPAAEPEPDAFPFAALPARRDPADADSLAPGTVLGAVTLVGDSAGEARYREEIGDDLSLYAAERLIHPGRLLHGCNLALSQNVLMGPWIHAGSRLEMFGPARFGDTVELRPRVEDRFEKKGHQFVVLDILAAVGDRPVMRCLHTAIYKLRSRRKVPARR
jgi:acyl dehydratase